MLVDRPPQVVGRAVDLDEHLVEVPLVAGAGPAAAQPVGVGLPELGAPLPDRFVGDHDAALRASAPRPRESSAGTGDTATRSGDDLHRVPVTFVQRRRAIHQPRMVHTVTQRPSTPDATNLTMPSISW